MARRGCVEDKRRMSTAFLLMRSEVAWPPMHRFPFIFQAVRLIGKMTAISSQIMWVPKTR